MGRLRVMGRLVTRLLAAAALAAILVTVTPVVRWWALWLSPSWTPRPLPIVVVLAGEEMGDGTIGYSTYLRCVYAGWAYRSGGVETLILSGGPPRRPAATAMADFLTGLGVPRERIRTETASLNTRQNIENVAAMLEAGSHVTLVTSDYHMRRAILLAQRRGMKAEPYPIPDVLKREQEMSQRISLVIPLAMETAKLTWEWVTVRGVN